MSGDEDDTLFLWIAVIGLLLLIAALYYNAMIAPAAKQRSKLIKACADGDSIACAELVHM
jgi:hypothetical protein